ncbi:AAEL010908-PA [Aedes aegypti]|uniref:AAEL010908-PA n=1 Tax=Aedes aegypti TaxID=7159 RepID=Q16RM1_AEDAE|nr:AAEL010908-PA [Aedes aegypti]
MKFFLRAIEDEGNHGNDETRLFILSSLAAQHKSRVACVLCEEPMLVFDRYPLVDGTFFLSPKQHAKGCIEVKYENRVQYLTSVCMACLDGVEQSRVVRCRFCAQKWDGSSLVLGTMYSYDIFAAMPCCTERLKCNNCFKLLLHPHQRLNFYSDYSHSVSCPYCHAQDTHFVKPLAYCYTKQPMQLFQHIATCSRSNSTSSAAASPPLTSTGVDSMAAMNSFIRELRNLNSSTSSSAMSNSSFDSGFSASFAGDSNGSSGRATAIAAQPLQPQSSNIVWGNKSLWGVPPPSPSPGAIKSSTVDLSSTFTNTSSNSMYVSSKDSSSTSSGGSIWASSMTANPSTVPSQSRSSNFSANIWENSGTKANPEPLGSIWMIPETGRGNVWGTSSQLLRPTEIGSATGTGNDESKLSSLWGTSGASSSSSTSSSGNVLNSLRLAGTVGAGGVGPGSSFGGLGGLITSPSVTGNTATMPAATASTMQLFSDDFLSYLNINN